MTPLWPVEVRSPHFSLSKVKALVFDLDDTLYFIPSGAQFYRYGEHLSSYLPEDERKAYLRELKRSSHDGSPVKVGRAFDPDTGLVLEFDDHWKLKGAFSMDGTVVPKRILHEKYRSDCHVDEMKGLIHLSSGWGIPSALGRLHGLGREHFRAAYVATRKDMFLYPDQFPLVVPAKIRTFLRKQKEENRRLFVMTNSDLGDAEAILKSLKIRVYFDKIYAEARKPHHSIPIFEEISQAFKIKYPSLLVIGDSVYNDLREAKSLGAQTVLIERFPNQPLGMVDVRVWDFEGFIRLWRTIKVK